MFLAKGTEVLCFFATLHTLRVKRFSLRLRGGLGVIDLC